MRFIAAILSVYIVFLTVLPCIDSARDHADCSEIITKSIPGGHHDKAHCSPFCTCECCASPVIQQENIIQFQCLSIPGETLFEYSHSFASSYHSLIWQPPKAA